MEIAPGKERHVVGAAPSVLVEIVGRILPAVVPAWFATGAIPVRVEHKFGQIDSTRLLDDRIIAAPMMNPDESDYEAVRIELDAASGCLRECR
jgi:hypothetical protein